MNKKNKSAKKVLPVPKLSRLHKLKQKQENFTEKRNPRKVRWTSIILTGFLLFSVVQCGEQYMRILNMKKELKNYEVTYQDAQKRQIALKQKVTLFQNPSYLERLARGNLRLVKPGEYLVMPAEQSDALDLDEGAIPERDLH